MTAEQSVVEVSFKVTEEAEKNVNRIGTWNIENWCYENW